MLPGRRSFFAWCDKHHIGGIIDIEPLHVAASIETQGQSMAKPTVKQHPAAVRMLFDWLLTGQEIAVNPVQAVRGPKHITGGGQKPPRRPRQDRGSWGRTSRSPYSGGFNREPCG